MANPAPTIGLPNTSLAEAMVVQELNAAKLRMQLGPCFQRCITHFDEDSIPHHPGEKVCMDRCMAKLGAALQWSKDCKKEFDARGQDMRDGMLPKFIAALDREHAHHPRNVKV